MTPSDIPSTPPDAPDGPDSPLPHRPSGGETDHGAFLVTRQGGAGLTHKRTRAQRYAAPSRGVRYDRLASDPQLARISAAALVTSATGLLCDISAARVWDLPLPAWLGLDPDVPIAVAVPPGASRPQRRQVRGRRLLLPEGHLTEHRGLPVTTPARTWLDCATLIPLPHAVAMGDVILRRGLSSPDELERMVRWGRGRRGVTVARAGLPMLDPRAESPGESQVRAHLLIAGLPRPQCNLDIVVGGEWLARADLAWPGARLIVEYDGAVHLDEQRRRQDAARRNLLQDAGWQVIVLTAADVARPWAMAGLVRSALASRAPRSNPRER